MKGVDQGVDRRFNPREQFDENYRLMEKGLRQDKQKLQELADLLRSTRKPTRPKPPGF